MIWRSGDRRSKRPIGRLSIADHPITRFIHTAKRSSDPPATRGARDEPGRRGATSDSDDGRSRRAPAGSHPFSSNSSDCASAAEARPRAPSPIDAADDRHHADLAQHHRRAPAPAPRRAPSAGRSPASAATRCRRARRRVRPPRAASRDTANAADSTLMNRSRKTFSRTCCGIVRRFSTGRLAIEPRERPSGCWRGTARGSARRPHVEVDRADVLRPGGTGWKNSGGISRLTSRISRPAPCRRSPMSASACWSPVIARSACRPRRARG